MEGDNERVDKGLKATYTTESRQTITNPHFDDNRVVWDDDYTNVYGPTSDSYTTQFDHQWELLLEGNKEFAEHASNIDDKRINDRVFEITGKHPDGKIWFPREHNLKFTNFIPADAYKDKCCADIGCGPGRWTKTMLAMGARSVLSVDASEHAIESVSRFNPKVLRSNLFDLPEKHPEIISSFDAAICWGVLMCTHDPKRAFDVVASTIKPGGNLYIMVYAAEGDHGKSWRVQQREWFQRKLTSYEERMSYCEHLANLEWDRNTDFIKNSQNTIKKLIKDILRMPHGKVIGYWDAMMPFYNWVIDRPTLERWYTSNGFSAPVFLNDGLKKPQAYHVYGVKL